MIPEFRCPTLPARLLYLHSVPGERAEEVLRGLFLGGFGSSVDNTWRGSLCPSLAHLDLGFNGIGDVGAGRLAAVLGQ